MIRSFSRNLSFKADLGSDAEPGEQWLRMCSSSRSRHPAQGVCAALASREESSSAPRTDPLRFAGRRAEGWRGYHLSGVPTEVEKSVASLPAPGTSGDQCAGGSHPTSHSRERQRSSHSCTRQCVCARRRWREYHSAGWRKLRLCGGHPDRSHGASNTCSHSRHFEETHPLHY